MAYQTFPVAGAAYKTLSMAATLTHAYDAEANKVLCGKVRPESILDDGAWGEEGCTESVPTCPTCAKRLAKLGGGK